MAELRPHAGRSATRRRARLSARERREVILDAAEAVFARYGYHRASLDEIAQAAGVSKALIYEHFASKRELHSCLLDAHAREIFASLRHGIAQGATNEERLRSGIDAFLAYVEAHREAWRALLRDAAEPDAAELIAGMQRETAAVVAALMDPDPDLDGAARDLRVAMNAQLLAGGVQSLAGWWHEHPEVPRAVLVDEATAWGRGMAGPPAALRSDAR